MIRYADGVPAIVERQVGKGIIVAWGIPLTKSASSLVTQAAFPLLCQALVANMNELPMTFSIGRGTDALDFAALFHSLGTIKGIDKIAGEGYAPADFGELTNCSPDCIDYAQILVMPILRSTNQNRNHIRERRLNREWRSFLNKTPQ